MTTTETAIEACDLACAGMAPAAIVERLAATTNVNHDIAILALQAT